MQALTSGWMEGLADFLTYNVSVECGYGRSELKGGVIHSFDGSMSELNSFLAFDNIFIGAPRLTYRGF